jgi:Fe-S-cluster containining protein
MAGNDSLCARCARQTRTCCQDTDVYVTRGDVERISDYTGRDDFFEFRRPIDPRYLEQDDDPLWREAVFRPDGTRRVVKHVTGGDCGFLQPDGCSLPRPARPLICRLHPYQYDESGLLDDLAEQCLAALLAPAESLAKVLDMDLEQARAWHAQLYRELRSEENPSCTSV